MIQSAGEVWTVIALVGVGTFVLRFSFLGLIGDRPLPPFLLRLLRYTPVAVLPAMVAPLVLWPPATGGEPDLPRLLAALATAAVAYRFRSIIAAVGVGAVVLYGGLALTGG